MNRVLVGFIQHSKVLIPSCITCTGAKILSLTSLCGIPVSRESAQRDEGIRVESNPKSVTMGYQDWRPLTGAELTNQGRSLKATISVKYSGSSNYFLFDLSNSRATKAIAFYHLQSTYRCNK